MFVYFEIGMGGKTVIKKETKKEFQVKEQG